MSAPLVAATDLPNYLNARVPEAQVQLLVNMVSAVVRDYCGWRIDREAADELKTDWSSPAVLLPTLALNGINSLTVAGNPVDPADYRWSSNGVIRWSVPRIGLGEIVANVDHGYDPVPMAVQAVVIAAVARVVVNPGGLRSLNTGAYAETYALAGGEPAGIMLLTAEQRILDKYRIFG